MTKYIYILFLLFSTFSFSQIEKENEKENKSLRKTTEQRQKDQERIAPITSYKIVSIEKDTTIVDTSLTIQSLYKYNYLKKDLFGQMPFPNEGQTYNQLQFALKPFTYLPNFGHKAKHAAYIEANEINYYNVATPLTELYFKTVMEQGQNVDSFVTLNTAPNFNLSIAFKGLRSLGKYINQLTSNGNFRFTTSYHTKNKKYFANFHFTGQDISNGENGGITTIDDFESNNPAFNNRPRLQVFLKDANSFLKGKRYFIDHSFRINSKDAQNNIYITHQLNYEHKMFEYSQTTIASIVGTNTSINRFGDALVTSKLLDQSKFDNLYNKAGIQYENKTIGKLSFFIENLTNKKYYEKTEDFIVNTILIPNQIKTNTTAIGGNYQYRKNKWNGTIQLSNALTSQTFRNLAVNLKYNLNEENIFTLELQNISKLPDNIYSLNQSYFEEYNWNNSFKNEKINNISIDAKTKWLNATLQLSVLDDYLYFSNNTTDFNYQYITPKQYNGSIKYLSIKASKEIKYHKFALDNTILFQQTQQTDAILNVPKIVSRNTIYYSNYFFKRALFLQTGVTSNYFTKYFANDYNPVIADFFSQNTKKIGNFPMLDLFVNARIRQTRIFVIAEHINSNYTGNTFYSAPNTPYHDFMIRFGLVWNFFQ